MKNRFLYSKSTLHYTMTERMVQLPVFKEVRDKLKIQKRELSYTQFLQKVVDNELMINGGMWK